MEVFMSIFVCFLTVYGAFHILYNVSLKLSTSDKVCLDHCHRVIIVKDESDDLEAYIRTTEATLTKNEFIILVDCLNHECQNILFEQLCREFSCVKVMIMEEYIDYVRKIV